MLISNWFRVALLQNKGHVQPLTVTNAWVDNVLSVRLLLL